MAHEWDETCLVCGVKIKNRCSNCAKAGVDLFFCSPAHQKLVWKTHRRDEAREIIAHLDDTTGMLMSYDPPRNTIAKALQAWAGVTRGQERRIIESITVGAPPPTIPELQQLYVLVVRAHEFARNPAPVLSLTAPSEPFNDFVNEDLHITQDETGDAPHYGFEPWRTMFRHHRLIYVLMADRVRTRGSGGTEYLEALFRLRTRGIDFIRTKVAATHPKVAEQMLASTAQAGQDMREMGMPSLPL